LIIPTCTYPQDTTHNPHRPTLTTNNSNATTQYSQSQLATHDILSVDSRLGVLERAIHVVKRLELSTLLHEYPPLKPPRSSFASLVGAELGSRDSEYVIEFLQSALLSLGNEEEDHHERADVQSRVEAEGTYVMSAVFSWMML